MPVYTRRLGEHLFSGTRDVVTLFTVPTGQIWIVRDIIATNGQPTELDFYLYVVLPAGGLVFFRQLIPPRTAVHEELRLALNAGEAVNTGNAISGDAVLVTGYVFNLP